MFKKTKDVVTTVGSQIKERVIEGEYLGKGGVTVAAGAGSFFLSGNALAAVPASVTTAITDAVADVGTIGAAILGVIIVIAAFNWMRKPIH